MLPKFLPDCAGEASAPWPCGDEGVAHVIPRARINKKTRMNRAPPVADRVAQGQSLP